MLVALLVKLVEGIGAFQVPRPMCIVSDHVTCTQLKQMMRVMARLKKVKFRSHQTQNIIIIVAEQIHVCRPQRS